MPAEGRTLIELEMRSDFVRRHIGPGEEQIAEMLSALGLESLDELENRLDRHRWP
jgi:glycine dehydrogenase